MITSRVALTATCVTLLIAGCGSNVTPLADPPIPTIGTATGDPGGWIGGEPDWAGASESDAGTKMYSSAAAGTAAPAAMDASAVLPGVGPVSGPIQPVQPVQPVEQPGLRAGSVDDNADFADFLTYLARIHDLGIATREFDPTGRIVVAATGTTGLPAAGAQVTVTADGIEIATLRTTADGTARFLPALYGVTQGTQATQYTFTTGDVSVTAAPGSTVALQAAVAGGGPDTVALDVMFLLDATGSMGDEIGRLKDTIDAVAAQVEGFDSKPDVRFAMTLYRDQGDMFVTSTFDFTSDIGAFRAALDDVVAEGGGDYPEALEEGLASALSEPSWRDPASTLQLMFLVADAPPHIDRQVPVAYPAAVVDAVSRGIKVFPIASSESDDQAEAAFREIAAATGARFVFLSYGALGAATGESTDIAATDYEELPLDALVVRLIAEELAALSGTQVTVPPTTLPPVTNPQGQ